MSDSSFKNGNTSLNEILVKGPNTLNDIYNNLVKFRSYEIGLMFDLTKAYNSLLTGMVERHCRRMWMRLSPEDPWCLWGFNTVQFGDMSAAALLSVAVEKASENWEEVAKILSLPPEEVKEDAIKALHDVYVDDGTSGGNKQQVDRMQGTRGEDGQFTGTIPTLFKTVGLTLQIKYK